MSNNLDLLENPTSWLRYDIPPWIHRIYTPRYTIYTPTYIALETYIAEIFLIFSDICPHGYTAIPLDRHIGYTPLDIPYTPLDIYP